MQLTQPEIIQILRRRKGLNQAQLGVQAFGITPDSARTKIKNIELGRQSITAQDAQDLASVLDVPASDLAPQQAGDSLSSPLPHGQCIVALETLQLFPGLADYIEMLNNAVRISDQDLIGYIASRIADVFAMNYKGKAVSHS